jgi:hypothetical protein
MSSLLALAALVGAVLAALVCEAPSNFDFRSFTIFVLLEAPSNALSGRLWERRR